MKVLNKIPSSPQPRRSRSNSRSRNSTRRLPSPLRRKQHENDKYLQLDESNNNSSSNSNSSSNRDNSSSRSNKHRRNNNMTSNSNHTTSNSSSNPHSKMAEVISNHPDSPSDSRTRRRSTRTTSTMSLGIDLEGGEAFEKEEEEETKVLIFDDENWKEDNEETNNITATEDNKEEADTGNNNDTDPIKKVELFKKEEEQERQEDELSVPSITLDYGYGTSLTDNGPSIKLGTGGAGGSTSSFEQSSTSTIGSIFRRRKSSIIISSTTGRALLNDGVLGHGRVANGRNSVMAYDSHTFHADDDDDDDEYGDGDGDGNNGRRNSTGRYDPQYIKICQLDKERERLLAMVEEPNMFKLLNHWKGTILDEIVFDVVFWLTLVLYIILRLCERLDITTTTGAQATKASDVLDSLPIVGGFLTLFLVFFVNQNHTRYYSLHEDTMCIMGRICDLSALMVSCLPIERARRINRYCNAAQVVMYAGLSTHLQEGKLIQNLCRDYALLTDTELSRMVQTGVYSGKTGSCFELLTWALIDVNRALQLKLLDPYQASEMRQQIVQFRSTIAKIFVTTLCPIPFFYVHFLALLTAIYLPLFAMMVSIKTGSSSSSSFLEEEEGDGEVTTTHILIPWYAELVGVGLVLFQSILVIGLRMLGQQLGNPYGEDFIDLQMTTYITMTLSTSNRILEVVDINNVTDTIHDDDIDPLVELDLKMQMVSLGDAYGIKPQPQLQLQEQHIQTDDKNDDTVNDKNNGKESHQHNNPTSSKMLSEGNKKKKVPNSRKKKEALKRQQQK